MARLIVKSPYIKCGGGRNTGGYLRYIGTRERVGVVVDRVLDELVFAAVLYAVPLFQSAQRVRPKAYRHFCSIFHNFLHFSDMMSPTAPQTPCFRGILRSQAAFPP